MLEAMRDASCDASTEESAKQTEYNNSTNAVGTNVTDLMRARCDCFKKGNTGTECESYTAGLGTLNGVASTSAINYLVYQGFASLAGNPDAINREIEKIDAELSSLGDDLNDAGFGLPEISSVPVGPQPAAADNWLQFDYNSKTEDQREESETTSTSFGYDFGSSFNIFSVSGSYSRSTSDQFSSFKSTEVRVAGELLRVTVQMPWFRPEIFREKRFTLVIT